MAKLFNSKRSKVLVSGLFLVLSLASLTTTTLAWFTSKRVATTSLQSTKVVGPDSAVVYQYKGNYTTVNGSKVYGGWNYNLRASRAFTSLSDDFETVDELSFSNFTPRAAYTFAFDMTKSMNPNISVLLNSFTCTKYSTRTDGTFIYLSEAISIYTSAYYYTDTGTDTLSTAATTHLQNASLTDEFVQTGSTGSNITLFDEAYAKDKMMIFMTIVCSDDSSTYYSYDTTSSEYTKDSSNGNSNAFKSLDITFSLLYLMGVDS